jgi:ABC-type nickel/cobalt efflux system permease component RcnA
MSIDELIVLSNIALVIVTALAAWVGFREGHRHEEHETSEMASIVHEVLAQERRMEDDRHQDHSPDTTTDVHSLKDRLN